MVSKILLHKEKASVDPSTGTEICCGLINIWSYHSLKPWLVSSIWALSKCKPTGLILQCHLYLQSEKTVISDQNGKVFTSNLLPVETCPHRGFNKPVQVSFLSVIAGKGQMF